MSESTLWRNILVNADANKHSLCRMYPAGTEYVSTYLEARGGPYPATIFVGLQAFLMEYLARPITIEDVDAAEEVLGATGMGIPFDRTQWTDLVDDHGGYLPIEIEAVPEGTVLPLRNVQMQLVNTDPKYYWIPGFIECAIQRALWYPSTVGTLSWQSKQFARGVLERASDHPELLRTYLTDYGVRGVSSFESGALAGLAHMVSFDGSDNVAANIAAKQYYNAGFTRGAAFMQEHTVVIAAGEAHEADTFRALLANHAAGSAGLLADTYDHDNAVRTIIGKELHDEVAAYPGLVTVRCDSGDVIVTSAETVESLMDSFGFTVNSKGYKVLPDNIRVVQGDGLVVDTFCALYTELERRGLAPDNVICGMGGGLLQRVSRDTSLFGYKANAAMVDGEWRDIAKKPKGSAFKASKAGRLALQYVDGDYRTVRRESVPAEENVLVPVFRNGEILRTWDFSELIAASERPTPEYYYAGVGPAPVAVADPTPDAVAS